MKHIHFTQEGFDNIQKEQENLEIQRKITVIELRKARDMGDLSENGFYKATKMRLGQIDHRLGELGFLIKTAKVIENSETGIISIGSTVLLRIEGEKQSYKIVGEYEANSLEGKISNVSPLGRLLLGKKKGDVVELKTNQTRQYEILSIS